MMSDQKKKAKPMEEEARPVNLEELLSVSLKRDFIERKIEEPYFDRMVVGCFVRIGIGMHNERPVYRVAEIIGQSNVFLNSKRSKRGRRSTELESTRPAKWLC